MSCGHSEALHGGMVVGFDFGGWDIADGFKQPAMIEPVDPGTVKILVCKQAVEHYGSMALVNRSPNRTANCGLAITLPIRVAAFSIPFKMVQDQIDQLGRRLIGWETPARADGAAEPCV